MKPSPPPATPSIASRLRRKILIVDDNPVTLEVLRDWLRDAGFDVAVRQQALGTAEWIAEERPDFVLLDVLMPALSGGSLARLLSSQGLTRTASVILHSSLEGEALSQLARSVGALGAITKTSDAARFLREFERLVEQRSARSR